MTKAYVINRETAECSDYRLEVLKVVTNEEEAEKFCKMANDWSKEKGIYETLGEFDEETDAPEFDPTLDTGYRVRYGYVIVPLEERKDDA